MAAEPRPLTIEQCDMLAEISDSNVKARIFLTLASLQAKVNNLHDRVQKLTELADSVRSAVDRLAAPERCSMSAPDTDLEEI